MPVHPSGCTGDEGDDVEVTREQWEAWIKAGSDPATCPGEARHKGEPIRLISLTPTGKPASHYWDQIHSIKINPHAKVFNEGGKITETVKHTTECSWFEDDTTCNCILKDFMP